MWAIEYQSKNGQWVLFWMTQTLLVLHETEKEAKEDIRWRTSLKDARPVKIEIRRKVNKRSIY